MAEKTQDLIVEKQRTEELLNGEIPVESSLKTYWKAEEIYILGFLTFLMFILCYSNVTKAGG